MTTLTVTTRPVALCHGRFTALMDALRGAGKDARYIAASLYEATYFMALPIVRNDVVEWLPNQTHKDTEVLVVEDLEHASPGTQNVLLGFAGNLEAARVHMPKLEAILFI